ncbi:MAG: DNA repair protein RadA [Bacteroidetes bacterium]|nr:MAG: DNA repair protein RadA [Bacteroidota bacterium]
MAKPTTKYVCQSCGYVSPRWTGKCPNCDGWNSFVEEAPTPLKVVRKSGGVASKVGAVSLKDVDALTDVRFPSGVGEVDRVLGGGIVAGSVILLGGDPGIGKSTLMMQVALHLKNKVILYVTGEESPKQVKLRAERLGRPTDNIQLLAETNLESITDVIESGSPDIVIVDSIQTLYNPNLESAPGSVGQVRESTAMLTRIAKTKNIPIILIGHVTKEGAIAGPRVIEHMVDAVLQFEGEKHYAYRILRGIKNRFGSTNEIGIFEMHDTGLREVVNPSEVFLSERSYGASGATIVASMEGTRPILIEVQALVSTSSYGMPQRTATGFDLRRLQMLLAVLEKRVGINTGAHDVFVNVAGGIRIDEPAADLGIASSIVSSLRDVPVDSQTVAIGEVGLGGEIRTIAFCDKRVQEAAKLGFKTVIVPASNAKKMRSSAGITIVGVETVQEAIKRLLD